MKNNDNWGGVWTFQKLNAIEKYVKVYLTIMNKQRYKYGWNLIYFDGFAGSGVKEMEYTKNKNNLLFDIELSEISIYKSAAERIIKYTTKRIWLLLFYR